MNDLALTILFTAIMLACGLAALRRKRTRARDRKGRFLPDNPHTSHNEAWK